MLLPQCSFIVYRLSIIDYCFFVCYRLVYGYCTRIFHDSHRGFRNYIGVIDIRIKGFNLDGFPWLVSAGTAGFLFIKLV